MNKNGTKFKATDFQEMLAKDLKNPEFKRYYDEYGKQLEISYQMLQMRKRAKMSQAQLARKIGTTQSNVARMEAGNQNFTVGLLTRIAGVFGKDLQISFG